MSEPHKVSEPTGEPWCERCLRPVTRCVCDRANEYVITVRYPSNETHTFSIFAFDIEKHLQTLKFAGLTVISVEKKQQTGGK